MEWIDDSDLGSGGLSYDVHGDVELYWIGEEDVQTVETQSSLS